MNAELDIFEGQGTEPTVYYGTLHKDTNSLCGISDETNDGYQMRSIDLTAGFHTYAALWTTADVIWYLDGVEVTRTPTYVSTDQEMYIILQMWTGGWTSGTNATTPDELRTEVDWVRVWQG
jgi:beta-glucanase (GH16 family)